MQAAEIIEFRQAREVGDVLNVTFHFLRQNVVKLGKSLLFIVAPLVAVASVFSALMQASWFGLANTGNFEGVNWTTLGGQYAGAIFFGVLGTVLAVAVVYSYVELYRAHGPDGFEVDDVWQATRQSFGRMFVTALVIGMLLFVPVVLVVIPCLGAIAYLVGIVYFGVIFSLVFPLRMHESIGLIDGLKRCQALVKDYWWATAAVILIAVIAYFILSLLFGLPAMVMTFLTMFHGLEGGGGRGYELLLVAAGLLSGLGNTLIYSIPLVAAAFQYYNLVERKERTGLMEKIDRLAPPETEGE